jgi:cytochrome c oxidase subunit I+III
LHGFASTSYTIVAWQGLHTVLLTLMAGYTLARVWAGMIDANRRNVFDNTRIMWYYSAAQGLIALLVLHSPRFGG